MVAMKPSTVLLAAVVALLLSSAARGQEDGGGGGDECGSAESAAQDWAPWSAASARSSSTPSPRGTSRAPTSTRTEQPPATLIGVFSLSDDCRTGAAEAIPELRSMSISSVMLNGDSTVAAMHAQEQLGGVLEELHADLLPEDKVRLVGALKARAGPMMMIGDGMNDAPAAEPEMPMDTPTSAMTRGN